MVTVLEGNRILAARARDLAARAEPGTLARKAAGCASVALDTTNSVKSAQAALDVLWEDDVRQAALAVIDQLTTGPES
jgi:hypothetical protein